MLKRRAGHQANRNSIRVVKLQFRALHELFLTSYWLFHNV